MHSQTNAQLDDVLLEIEKRWGREALRPLKELPRKGQWPAIATGFTALDQALGIGGIPRLHLTTLLGKPTSGATSLAYSIIAHAQKEQLGIVYIDPANTFDPEAGIVRGVNLEFVLLTRPETWEQALELLRDLVGIRVAGLMVLDAVFTNVQTRLLGQTLQRVGTLLPHSSWTLLVLLPHHSVKTVDSSAAVRLVFKRQSWLYTDDLLRGYQVQVIVQKNKFGAAGQVLTVDMLLGDESV